MSEQRWRPLAEMTLDNLLGDDQALRERLAAATRELSLPHAVLERLQRIVLEAGQRAARHDGTRAARLAVSVQATAHESGGVERSWGFFLVEKRVENGAGYRIEVFLYPEGS
jgi:hypothetical protein